MVGSKVAIFPLFIIDITVHAKNLAGHILGDPSDHVALPFSWINPETCTVPVVVFLLLSLCIFLLFLFTCTITLRLYLIAEFDIMILLASLDETTPCITCRGVHLVDGGSIPRKFHARPLFICRRRNARLSFPRKKV